MSFDGSTSSWWPIQRRLDPPPCPSPAVSSTGAKKTARAALNWTFCFHGDDGCLKAPACVPHGLVPAGDQTVSDFTMSSRPSMRYRADVGQGLDGNKVCRVIRSADRGAKIGWSRRGDLREPARHCGKFLSSHSNDIVNQPDHRIDLVVHDSRPLS